MLAYHALSKRAGRSISGSDETLDPAMPGAGPIVTSAKKPVARTAARVAAARAAMDAGVSASRRAIPRRMRRWSGSAGWAAWRIASASSAMKTSRGGAWTRIISGPGRTNPPNRSTKIASASAARAAASSARAHPGTFTRRILPPRQRPLLDVDAPQHQITEGGEGQRPAQERVHRHRGAEQLADDADVVRVRDPPIRPARNHRRPRGQQETDRQARPTRRGV